MKLLEVCSQSLFCNIGISEGRRELIPRQIQLYLSLSFLTPNKTEELGLEEVFTPQCDPFQKLLGSAQILPSSFLVFVLINIIYFAEIYL